MIRSVIRYWGRYRDAVFANCEVLDAGRMDLPFWRNSLFAATLVYLIPLSFIALIPGIYMSWVSGLYLLVWMEVLTVLLLLGTALAPALSVHLRKLAFVVVLYVVSVGLLYYLGSYGPGLLYLFAITVFVILIFEKRIAAVVVLLNILICVLFGFALYYERWESLLLIQYDLGSWIAVSSNLVFLSLISLLLIPEIFRSLQSAIQMRLKLSRELEETNARLELAQQIGGLGYWSFDMRTEKLYWSDPMYRIWEVDPETFVPSFEAFFRTVHPEDRPELAEARKPAIEGLGHLDHQHRIVLRDGRIKWIHQRAQLIRDRNGGPERFDGVAQDVTEMTLLTRELKEKANELRESEKSYRELFDLSPLPMYLFDLELLHFLDVNDVAVEHYGYSKSEFMEMTIRDIRPPEDLPGLEESLKQTRHNLYTGRLGVFRHIKKSGEMIWVELQCSNTVYKGREARIILATDVTSQKKQREELLTSLREKETLLAEVHHRVKNNLAVVSGVMQLQAMRADNEVLNKMLFDSVRRIKTMANIHEHLYRSDSFAHLDFSSSLKQLVSDILNTGPAEEPIRFQYRSEGVRLNINQAVPCSMIANEVVTNAIKHAFDGSVGNRLIVDLTESENRIRLVIEDNGIGLSMKFDEQAKRSMGFQLIDLLSQQLHGTFSYQASGDGTRFELQFERADVKGPGSGILMI